MKKLVVLSLLCGMLSVGGVFGFANTASANEPQSLTLPAGLFEGSSKLELRYDSGVLNLESLTGNAFGVTFVAEGEAVAHAEKVSIVTTGTLTDGDLVIKELIIDGLALVAEREDQRLTVERLKILSSGTWSGGDLVINRLEAEGFEVTDELFNYSVHTVLIKSLPIAELMAGGAKLSNAAMRFEGLDVEAIQRGDMGPIDQESVMALIVAIKDVAEVLNGFDLELEDFRYSDDDDAFSLGPVKFGVRDGFWFPEFLIENFSYEGTEMVVKLEAVHFDLTGSLSSRLSALFEIVGLGLHPVETARQKTRQFFEILGGEEVIVDFGTQLLSTVEQAGVLAEMNFAFAVSELMGFKFEFASRSPTSIAVFLNSSKFADSSQDEWQAAMQKIMTQGQLDHAQLTLTNWNAVDMVIKALAQQSGQPEEQLRMTAEMMINMFVGRGTPVLAETSDALLAFLKTPGTLQASFRPPEPLPAANTPEFNTLVANPGALIEALGLSVKFIDPPMSIESHRLTQADGASSKQVGSAANGMPEALPPIPASNVADWLSARRAYAEGDYETVLRLMVPYAEADVENAQRVVAHAYKNTNEFDQAAAWYQGLAEKGDAASQFYLGMLYQKGLGVEQDTNIALDLLNKAAAQGDARAMHALALSTQTIEVVKGINPGLSARAQEVLTDVIRSYYNADDPAGIHFSGKSDVRIPTALWERIIARWRIEGVMPRQLILQAVAG